MDGMKSNVIRSRFTFKRSAEVFMLHIRHSRTELRVQRQQLLRLHTTDHAGLLLDALEGYGLLLESSVTFLMLCWTQTFCWSSSCSRRARSSSSAFRSISLLAISLVLQPGPTPLKHNDTHACSHAETDGDAPSHHLASRSIRATTSDCKPRFFRDGGRR